MHWCTGVHAEGVHWHALCTGVHAEGVHWHALCTGVHAEGMHWHALCTGVHAEGMHCAPECMPKACTGAPGWGGCFSTHERMPILSDVRVISAILELDSEFQLCMALHLARLRGGRLSRLLKFAPLCSPSCLG